MDKKLLIGIDIGTSGCKVILFENGSVLRSATVGYPLSQPKPGWSEQDPADWWAGVREGLMTVMNGIDGNIAGISFSGQMHGMVALDGDMEVVRPAILWNDQRTQAQCDEITAAAGGLDGLLSYTNNMMLTGYTGGKILWMKENEPENYAKTRLILNPKDYIRYRLTGEIFTDVSDASGTGLFDVERRTWANELMEKIGISTSLFPKCLESAARAGSVTALAAAETGLPEGTAVFAGGGDAVVSMIAMGLGEKGKIGITLGTSGVVAMGLPAYGRNKGGLLQMFCSNIPGGWMAFGCTLSAAGSYQWFHDALGRGSFKELDDLAELVEPGSGGLLFLPYLTGERCPVFDPEARGSFTGIASTMGRKHFARAVMEGVAFSMRQVYDLIGDCVDISPTEIVVSGGGARSPIWRQILADVFELPVVTTPGSAEGGAFGAAIIAGMGLGLWDAEEACDFCAVDSVTDPRPEFFPVYRKAFAAYKAAYGYIKQIPRH